MKVFEIFGDPDYAEMDVVNPDQFVQLAHAVNDSVAFDDGVSIPLRLTGFFEPGQAIATHSPFVVLGALLLREDAIACLAPFLENAGYFLDTTIGADTRYKLFVCEREIDALDQARSDLTRYTAGGVMDVLRYELDPHRIGDADIFRMTHRRAHLFVSDRFAAAVERAGLTGFKLVPIWSSEAGGTQLSPEYIPFPKLLGEPFEDADAKRLALRDRLGQDESQYRFAE